MKTTFHSFIFLTFLCFNFLYQTIATIVIRDGPVDTVIVQGNPLYFHCLVEDPAVRGTIIIQWKRNGAIIPTSQSSRVNQFANGTLFLTSTQSSDEGSYSCLISVVAGQVIVEQLESIAAQLYFAFIEDFFYPPEALMVTDKQEDPAYFQCVTGNSRPLADIHWQKDGQTFLGNTYQTTFGNRDSLMRSGTLQIDNVTKALEGSYRCVAVNPLLPGEPRYSNYAEMTVQANPGEPYFSIAPSSQIIPISQSASFNCVVLGDPVPSISWHLQSQPGAISNDDNRKVFDNGTLYIRNVQEIHEGSYYCKGSSRLGVVTSNIITLTTAYMNWTFLEEPIDVEVVEESSVTLICRPPLSKPLAEVVWYKNNLEYEPRAGSSVLDVGDLYFSSVTAEDEGRYFCVATNKYIPRSVTSRSATLEVRVGANIEVPPQNTEVILGNDLTLTCSATGDPAPTILWYRDNREITPGGRVTFGNSNNLMHIIGVTSLDQGTYSCEASNPFGLEFVSAYVDILVPPRIVQPPRDSSIGLGDPIFLPCEVIGDPFPTVTWSRNGTEISSLPESDRYEVNSQGLFIQDVSLEDGGRFACIAESDIGTDSASSMLTVEVMPEITNFSDNKTVSQGAVVFFQCEATGTPSPSLIWRFNGGPLPMLSSVSSGGQVLTVSSASRTSSGRYTCMAENRQGSAEVNIYLRVKASPIVSPINNITTSVGMSQMIVCNAEGYPEPLYSWLDGQDVIMPGGDVSFPEPNKMVITVRGKIDQGWYSCVASNDIGSDRQSFYLTVRDLPGKPIIDDAVAQSESSVLVTWQAGGDPGDTDSYQLQFKMSSGPWSIASDNIVASGNLQTFFLTGLIENREYHIRVLAQNNLGMSLPSEVFVVYTPSVSGPSAPRNVVVVAFNATSIQLEWEIPMERSGPIHSYRIEYSKPGHEGEKILEVLANDYTIATTISNLRPNSGYSIRICAATVHNNEKQWGNCSTALHLTTAKSAPDAPPTMFDGMAVSPTAIVLTWEAVPAENQNAPITGYKVSYRDMTRNTSSQETFINESVYSTILIGLVPFTLYSINIQAVNDYGPGPNTENVHVKTFASAPTDSPTGVHLIPLNQTVLRVTWEAVPAISRQGPIHGYYLYLRNPESLEEEMYDVIAPNTMLDISGLQIGSLYEVRLSAYNTVGNDSYEGPETPWLPVRTKDGKPGKVNSVSVRKPGPSHIYLQWDPPTEPNGILSGYLVEYAAITLPTVYGVGDIFDGSEIISRKRRQASDFLNSTHGRVTTNMTSYNVMDLEPATNYSFTIAAMTSEGPGDIVEIFASTGDPRVPLSPTDDVENVRPTSLPQGTEVFGLPLNSFIIFVSAMALAIFALLLAVITISTWCTRSLNRSHKSRTRHAPPLLRNDEFVQQRQPSSEELGIDNYSRSESGGSSSPNSLEAAPTSSHVLEQSSEGLLDHRHRPHQPYLSAPPMHYTDQMQTLPRVQPLESEMNPYGTTSRLERQRSRDSGTSPEQLDQLFTRVNDRSSIGPSRMKKDSLAAIAVLLDSEENDHGYRPPDSPPSVVISDQRTVL